MIVASPHGEPAHPIASISTRTHVALWAAAADAINAIKADALREAAEAWEDGAHDHQGTSPALWLADRAAALRSNEKGTNE